MLQPRQRSAFTLVEILVVLAIIGILAALIFPVFSRARERGQRATCQSNLKQIALATQQYVGDNDGRFPIMGYDAPGNKQIWWTDAIAPYVKAPAIFRCPLSRIENPVEPEYGYNMFDLNKFVVSPNTKMGSAVGLNESSFAALSDVVLNFDGFVLNMDGSIVNGSQIETSCGPQAASNLHGGGANYSYADGHVKWLNPQQQGEWTCGVLARSLAGGDNQMPLD